jgi:hypothetical protein
MFWGFNYQEEVSHPANALKVLLAVYVDPGSGSYYFQMVIAGLTTVFFFFTSIKRRVVSFLKPPGPSSNEKAASPKEALAKESDRPGTGKND